MPVHKKGRMLFIPLCLRMCKAVDKEMEIGAIRLIEKTKE